MFGCHPQRASETCQAQDLIYTSGYLSHFEVYLRYLVLYPDKGHGTIVVVIVAAPTVFQLAKRRCNIASPLRSTA